MCSIFCCESLKSGFFNPNPDSLKGTHPKSILMANRVWAACGDPLGIVMSPILHTAVTVLCSVPLNLRKVFLNVFISF